MIKILPFKRNYDKLTPVFKTACLRTLITQLLLLKQYVYVCVDVNIEEHPSPLCEFTSP